METFSKKLTPATMALLIVSIVTIGSVSAVAMIIQMRSVSNTVNVVGANFNVFSDQACTQPLTSLSWDQMHSGQPEVKVFYLLNTGDGTPVYVWWNSPDLPSYFTLQLMWNGGSWTSGNPYEQLTYPYSGAIPIQVTLTPNSAPSGGYSFTIAFTGQDTP